MRGIESSPERFSTDLMQIHIVSIGKIKEHYLREGIAEYQKRLPGSWKLVFSSFPEAPITSEHKTAIADATRHEGEQILKAVEGIPLIISLDRLGKQMTSEAFAHLIRETEIEGPYQMGFIIGGPHGLDEPVRRRSDRIISFSEFTFTHQMAQFILMEQIYRAYTIIKGIPYHR